MDLLQKNGAKLDATSKLEQAISEIMSINPTSQLLIQEAKVDIKNNNSTIKSNAIEQKCTSKESQHSVTNRLDSLAKGNDQLQQEFTKQEIFSQERDHLASQINAR